MTKSEYRELVEFLGVRFARIDERFETLETRLTRVEVLEEENRGLIRTVAEGVTTVDRKIEELRGEMHAGFREQRELLEASHGELDRRLRRVEARKPS